MQNETTLYQQHYYGDFQKTCEAKRIVYAEADEKLIRIHYMRHDNVMDELVTNDTSLLLMLAAHPGSFIHSNRHIIIRKRFLLGYSNREGNPKYHDAHVRFVDKPLEISRRRLFLVRDALL